MMLNLRFPMLTFALGTAFCLTNLTGCSGKSPLTPDAGVQPAPLPPPVLAEPGSPPDKPAGEKKEEQPIKFTLTAPKLAFKRGELITFTMTARNTTREKQTLQFSSGQDFDIAARESGKDADAPVWRWAEGKLFTRALRTVELAPDKTVLFEATWDQKGNNGSVLKRGDYTLIATLTMKGRIQSQPLTISLTD